MTWVSICGLLLDRSFWVYEGNRGKRKAFFRIQYTCKESIGFLGPRFLNRFGEASLVGSEPGEVIHDVRTKA